MKLLKLKRLLTFFLISLLLLVGNGCSIAPPNSLLCREKDIDRGRCTHIVSGESFDVDETHKIMDIDGVEKSWYQIRPYLIQMPLTSWAEIKAFILKVCKKYKDCGSIEPSVKSIDDNLVDKE